MYLVNLNDGDFAVIKKLPDSEAGHKMLELGLAEGIEFEKISGSPLGNIVTIDVNGRYFAITNDIAEAVEVIKK